jgi:hypothetical protein
MTPQQAFYDGFLGQIQQMAQAAFPDPRPRERVLPLARGLVCGDTPKTITSALDWLEQQQQDWSASYRLFSQSQWEAQSFFAPLLAAGLEWSPDPSAPLYTAQDDSLVRKTGRKIPNTSYLRDPLGPPFQVNLVLGQRFLQTSLLVRPASQPGPFRSIPVHFTQAAPLKAPPRASAEQKKQLKEARKKHNLSVIAKQDLLLLQQEIQRSLGGQKRTILHAVDGSFANKTFLLDLPPEVVVVARIRKNAHLRRVLPDHSPPGPRKYGEALPTPEEILQDRSIPFQRATIFVAGQLRTLQFKEISNLCWPKVRGTQPGRLLVIRAAGYRLRKGSKLLYREPAFLFCTDSVLAVTHLLQAYFARWEVEVNFRDEKSILGVGQAQVWNINSISRAPAFLVACYAALLLTSLKVFDDVRDDAVFGPLPVWRRHQPRRPSSRDLVALLRKLDRDKHSCPRNA